MTNTATAVATNMTEWLTQTINEQGPLTVAQVVELSGRSETTARKLLKSLVADGTLWRNDEVKPATFELITDTTEDEASEAEDEAKIDEIMDAITAEPKPKKSAKSKKVAHTDVPHAYDRNVRVNGETLVVTEAYALLVDPPTFDSADEAYAWANAAQDRGEGDHTADEIAGLYFEVVTDYLNVLLHDGDITKQVWYGRTFRLRRTLVGHGKGTASARPELTTSDE